MVDSLIEKFVSAQKSAQDLLAQGDVASAKQKYLEVLDAYHQIDQSSLEQFHKELAYDQVHALFSQVNEAKARMKIPYNLIVAGILIIALSTGIVLKPSIVGLAGFDDLVRQEVNLNITDSSIKTVTLRDAPLSLSASGEFAGKVKLFHKEGERLRLIFESNSSNGNFTDVCAETCTLSAGGNTVELFAQVEEGASIFIKEISYRVERKSNTAPRWTGASSTFRASVGKPTTIDLADYFSDDENDPLVFLSTSSEGLDVEVQNSNITLKPSASGTKNILFIASDLIAVTRVPVKIEVS